jgi:hypothetical protein
VVPFFIAGDFRLGLGAATVLAKGGLEIAHQHQNNNNNNKSKPKTGTTIVQNERASAEFTVGRK